VEESTYWVGFRMTFSPETQAALIADGEKLAALTGEDHGPWEAEDWEATLRYCEKQWQDERGVMIERIQAVKKVRDGYADQARFADIDCAVHFREFVRRIDAALATGMVKP
jgi:hypothetical protein